MPGETHFVTVQAVDRAMRFVPTRPVRDSIDYLFALLVTKYGLLVHEYLWMSNHWHLVVTDPRGELSAFLQELHSRVSRQLNALRGDSMENFARDPTIQVIVDGGGVVKQAVYTLANPVAAGLVERVGDWKGCSSLSMRYGQTRTFSRPTVGLWAPTRASESSKGKRTSRGRMRYRGRSKAPQTASFTLVRPADAAPELTDDELRDEVLARAETAAAEHLATRRAQGKPRALGWRAVVSQSYRATATSRRALFQTRPRVAGTDPAACRAFAEKIEAFERAYADARERFRDDKTVEFPFGTLQMLRRYDVPCATAPP